MTRNKLVGNFSKGILRLGDSYCIRCTFAKPVTQTICMKMTTSDLQLASVTLGIESHVTCTTTLLSTETIICEDMIETLALAWIRNIKENMIASIMSDRACTCDSKHALADTG